MRRAWTAWALAALAFSAPLQAADWTRVTAKDQHEHYYDRGKVDIEGEQITYWRRVVFRPAQPTRNGLAASAMYRERIDCGLHTHRTLGYLLYASDGSVLENVYTPEAPAGPIVPETVGDRFESAMCTLVARERSRNVARRDAQKAAKSVPPVTDSPATAAAGPVGGDAFLDPGTLDQAQLLAEIARLEARLAQLRARVLQRNASPAAAREMPPPGLPDPVVLRDEPGAAVLPAGTPTP